VTKPTPLVNAFFDSYRAAFERSDVSAIADHFAFPLHITSDTGEIALRTIPTRQDWIGMLQQLVAMYRAIGFSFARALNLVALELSSRLVQAVVHWSLLNSAGETLYDFNAAYSLATIDGVIRITAISHNEIPKYRECLARLQSQRAARDVPTGGLPSN
jgi:uncharacterized NTF2-like protein DUF6841